ncbi:PREDICTED: uncharacterized protein LOC109128041 [Camelina sativa]|uniref:Uncharacterized protein LOC109128041 n=1 Tax=Camelina sativa TaxID=90675 RepID=A0ABM1QR73_CAMSA|nr:PREDICTED: uncharacterized protein LOC109128041 [Camelina sativa]
MSLADCLPLLEKIRSRIGSWQNIFLSYADRLQLLSSVISIVTNFWISAFRLPSGCIAEIEHICSAFLWSGPDLNATKAKVAWRDVCLPKGEGGLGLKSIVEANKARDFLRKEVYSGKQTFFWFDHWCPLGPLHVVLGDRGVIDLGIPLSAKVTAALHRQRRQHRVVLLNKIEDEFDKVRARHSAAKSDIVLWRGQRNKFFPRFSTKITWSLIRA